MQNKSDILPIYILIFVDYMQLRIMDHIRIYSGKTIESRIYVRQTLKKLGVLLRDYSSVYVVYDENLYGGVIDRVLKVVSKDGRCKGWRSLVASEERKNIQEVIDICTWLMHQGADRDALVLGVGGGITTDMVGYAASIYKRGVNFAYIPTTLLSQVDASIGGKTGVNLDQFKNIIGLIRQPKFTYICPPLLSTLPMRLFYSGLSELFKTFIIEDDGNYAKAYSLIRRMTEDALEASPEGSFSEVWPEVLARHYAELTDVIEAAAAVKAGVVSRDQFESGERRKLNLGHTFAHAIETLEMSGENPVSHGDAVAMGIILAARLAEKMGEARPGFSQRLTEEFQDCALLPSARHSVGVLAEVMKKDKKAEGSKVHFVLPRDIGDVVIRDLSVEEVVALLS